MSDAPPQQPLGCAGCAEKDDVIRTLSDQQTEQAVEIAGLQLQLRRAGQAEVALRNQLAQAIDEDTDQDQIIRTLCDAWKRLLGHPKAKTPKTGARWKVAKAALRHHSPEECMEAIQGLALLPYVGPRGRCATGEESQRYDELKYALKDEETVARCRGYWQRAQAAAEQSTEAMLATWERVSALHAHWDALMLNQTLARQQEQEEAERERQDAEFDEALAEVIPLHNNREAA